MGPSPANAGAVASMKEHGAKSNGGVVGVDEQPLIEDGEGEDTFGGWDEEEDQVFIEQAERRRLKKKGINPKAGKKSVKADGSSGER